MTNRLVLIGPQRLRPTLGSAVSTLGLRGKVAAITAGWQEREEEDQELRDHLGGRTVNLHLYRRAEEVFAEDPKYFAAHRERQDRLRDLRGLYERRLNHAMAAARELFGLENDSDLVAGEREEAVETVRALDRHHLKEIGRIHRSFGRRWRPSRRRAIMRQRKELTGLLEECEALAVAGGHVAVLLNRLRLFGILELLGNKPVIAWSAGAMALADRIVLFHDSPPQGPGNAEVLEAGLGLIDGIQPFPHARHRLQLNDPIRVSLLARRLAPARCVALDEGDWLARNGSWRALAPMRLLLPDGTVSRTEGALPGFD